MKNSLSTNTAFLMPLLCEVNVLFIYSTGCYFTKSERQFYMSKDHRKLLVPCSSLTAQGKRGKGRSLKATSAANTVEQRLKTDFQCKSTFLSLKNVFEESSKNGRFIRKQLTLQCR